MSEHSPERFEKEASARRNSLAREVWLFLRQNKKWWLLPILIVVILLSLLVILSGSGIAPFIYTLF